MADPCWLTIIGLGEDGAEGLSPASLAALTAAEVIIGPPRHLALLPGGLAAQQQEWPVPFADGIDPLLALRGRRVAVLASGDPFWFGAGTVLARQLNPGEWRALPGPSVFSLMAARLGWGLETCHCLGLHAAPLSRLRPHLAPGGRLLLTVRDGLAVRALGAFLDGAGFASSRLHLLEALGGPRERQRLLSAAEAEALDLADLRLPLAVAVEPLGGPVLPLAGGRADTWFEHDGQISKRPVRALALSALAPLAGELLWDIGLGSGSVAIEWLLCHPACRATGFEADPQRADRARRNAAALGCDRLRVIAGSAPASLAEAREVPDAIFIGGGLSEELLAALLPLKARLVAHAVTLESEALLLAAHARLGGSLLRIDLAEAAPLGRRRGWKAAYPIVQWTFTP